MVFTHMKDLVANSFFKWDAIDLSKENYST